MAGAVTALCPAASLREIMMRNKNLFVALIVTSLLAGTVCAQSTSSADAQAQARDALRRLDDALSGKPTALPQNPAAPAAAAQSKAPAAAPAAAQSTRGGKEPSWVMDPYAAYPRSDYVAAVGFAPNRGRERPWPR